MYKLIPFLTILILLTGPIFGPATVWPANLDELYRLVDTGEGNWVFTTPCPADTPLLAWHDVKTMHADDEDSLFYAGALAYLTGELRTCKPVGDKVAFYGPALSTLMEYIK